MMWLCILASLLAVDLAPTLERFPADPPDNVSDVYVSFNEAPEEALHGLMDCLGSDTNSAVLYAVDGWTTYVLRPNADGVERAALAAGLAAMISETNNLPSRAFLLEQLGKVGVRESIAPVGRLLADPEWAQAASLALQAFGLPDYRAELSEAAREYLDGAVGIHRDILLQLAEPPSEPVRSVEWCRERLESVADHQVCDALVTLYGLIGDDAFPDVSAASDHPAPAVRAVALELLADCNAAPLVPWLKARLDHEDPQCRAEALTLLIDRDDPEAGTRALESMTDESEVVRRAAFVVVPTDRLLEAYIFAGGEERTALLRALVQRPGIADQARTRAQASADPMVQAAMLDVIGRCMARKYVDDAFAAVRSDHEALAKQGVKTLKRMAGIGNAGAVLALMQDDTLALPLRSGLVPVLVATLNEADDDEGRIAPVRERIATSDNEVRMMLHRVLAGVQAGEAVALLQADTANEEVGVRDSAVRSLCKWNGYAAAAPLLEVARATTNETHQALVLRRMVQLVKQYQAADEDNVERQDEARQQFEAALQVALRDEDKTMIQDSLDELTEKQKEDEIDE